MGLIYPLLLRGGSIQVWRYISYTETVLRNPETRKVVYCNASALHEGLSK